MWGFAYDGSGCLVSEHLPGYASDAHQRTDTSYDGANATVSRFGQVAGANDTTITQTYAWNPTGTEASHTSPRAQGDPVATWSSTYGPTNEVITETSPLGHVKRHGYDAHGNRLCFHVATVGRKLDIIARNPRACATIVVDLGYKPGECAHPFQSLVIEGRMRLLDDLDEARRAMRVLIGQLEGDDAVEGLFEHHELERETVFKRLGVLVLEIEDITAKEGE